LAQASGDPGAARPTLRQRMDARADDLFDFPLVATGRDLPGSKTRWHQHGSATKAFIEAMLMMLPPPSFASSSGRQALQSRKVPAGQVDVEHALEG